MLDGESVSYSFLHEPGLVEVHPSLGRLAFLIEPAGVKLHWMTDGPALDPSGLPADNAVEDPTGRRGFSPIPLKPNAWNQAKLSLLEGKVSIELNGQLVFERPVSPTDDRTFGFFHEKDQTTSRVRDVVLRGDWPETFEAARTAGLLARTRYPIEEADRRIGHALIGEDVLTQGAGPILGETRPLPPPERFEALARWVLPGPDHPTFRLLGTFTPLNPAEVQDEAPSAPRNHARVESGGDPESPAADLVEVARASGRLEELAARINSAGSGSPVDERGRFALLAMVRLAQGKDDEAVVAFARLQGMASTIKPGDPDWMRWPELTAGWSAIKHPNAEVRAAVLASLPARTAGPDQPVGDLFVRQVQQARAIGESGRAPATRDGPELGPWSPVSPAVAEERGRGFPRSSWTSTEGVWTNRSGRAGDDLLLGMPIRGDFEASADLSASPGREANFAYAGLAIRLRGGRKGIALREDEKPEEALNLTPPLEIKGDWASWRLRVQEGRMVVSIDGRTVFERSIPAEAPPWLAIETPGPLGGSARNVAVVGHPTVTERVRLSTLADLAGWSSAEYPSAWVDFTPAWRKRGDEIVGRSSASASPIGMNNRYNRNRFGWNFGNAPQAVLSSAGSKIESVLRLRRPLLEDGEVEYEFYHEPGKAMVHPALGRLAFVILPDGVAVHRLTDTPYERAGLDPGNLAVEPSRRRGPASPPLQPKTWNRLKLALTGDVATIFLNETLIYERPIEPSNSRAFGLFHFADESEARVREVIHRGGWPRSIPAPPTVKRD